jgi:hypothetical protein
MMIWVHQELDVKRLKLKLTLKSSLKLKVAEGDSQALSGLHIESIMKLEKLIEILWFKFNTFITSTNLLNGQQTTQILNLVVMSSFSW